MGTRGRNTLHFRWELDTIDRISKGESHGWDFEGGIPIDGNSKGGHFGWELEKGLEHYEWEFEGGDTQMGFLCVSATAQKGYRRGRPKDVM